MYTCEQNEGRRTLCFFRMAAFEKLILFIHLWLCWAFVLRTGFPLAAPRGVLAASHCCGFPLVRSLGSWSTGQLSVERGLFPGQGLNPCSLHWQAEAYPLWHQGNPEKASLLPPSPQ